LLRRMDFPATHASDNVGLVPCATAGINAPRIRRDRWWFAQAADLARAGAPRAASHRERRRASAASRRSPAGAMRSTAVVRLRSVLSLRGHGQDGCERAPLPRAIAVPAG